MPAAATEITTSMRPVCCGREGHDQRVSIVRLDPRRAAALRGAELTYARAALAAGSPSAGFRVLRRDRALAAGDFDSAADALMSWRVHSRAGLRVAVSSPQVRTDEVVVLTLGIGRLGLRAPCRVVEVIDEPERRGFVYGTLPGHPERGEESFVLHRGDGSMRFTIEATSQPATLLARLGGPITRRVQLDMIDRYLRAIT